MDGWLNKRIIAVDDDYLLKYIFAAMCNIQDDCVSILALLDFIRLICPLILSYTRVHS